MREVDTGTVRILPILHQSARKREEIRGGRGAEDPDVFGAAADEQAKTGGKRSAYKGNCSGDGKVR